MVKRVAVCLAVFVLMLQLGSLASAATIYDNGVPSTLNPGGSNMSDTVQAEDFTLSAQYSLTGIRFWSLEGTANDYLGSISWAIFSDNAGAPGSVLYSGSATPVRSAAGTALGLNQYQNDFSLTQTLAAGTYWLALHDGDLSALTFLDFYWAWSDPNSSAAGMEDYLNSGSWTTNDAQHAFVVYGDRVAPGPQVPEPASLVLLGSGLLGVVRRFKK